MSMTFICRSPDELREKLQRFVQVFPDGVKQGLWEQANVIMNESSEQVPVDIGYLWSTRYVNDPYIEGDTIAVEMGYYANYAAPVHDIPEPPAVSVGGRSAHHESGKWHYLEDPFQAHAPELAEKIVTRVEQMLGGG